MNNRTLELVVIVLLVVWLLGVTNIIAGLGQLVHLLLLVALIVVLLRVIQGRKPL